MRRWKAVQSVIQRRKKQISIVVYWQEHPATDKQDNKLLRMWMWWRNQMMQNWYKRAPAGGCCGCFRKLVLCAWNLLKIRKFEVWINPRRTQRANARDFKVILLNLKIFWNYLYFSYFFMGLTVTYIPRVCYFYKNINKPPDGTSNKISYKKLRYF